MSQRVLKRGTEEFCTSPQLWAEALLLAANNGWRPSTSHMNFLATNISMSEPDALGMSEALERLFDHALKEPHNVYPLRVDMGKLYLLKEFISGGRIEIVE